jgi:protocatechuate 3,4-dioxygenase beta subunit
MTIRSRLLAATVVCVVVLVSACSSTTIAEPTGQSSAVPTLAASTPEALGCQDPLVEQTEGPYYTAGAPERNDLTGPDTIGIPLTLAGRVLDAGCAPVAGAPIEFWQADGAGVYDNAGFELRGVQVTDVNGAYTLQTVIPGIYPSRTEHIHVKVTGPDGVVHTTQLYFPDVPQNENDGIYSDTMLVTVTDQNDDSMAATFDFVLP